MPKAEELSSYIIKGGEEGRSLLTVISRLLAPATQALFDRFEPLADLSAIDAGCGGGDVNFELAARVGPNGHVVGFDLDALKTEAEPLPEVAVEPLLKTPRQLQHRQQFPNVWNWRKPRGRPISPPVGEMSGRTEGATSSTALGSKDCYSASAAASSAAPKPAPAVAVGPLAHGVAWLSMRIWKMK